jgi:hypothetical protein
LQIQITPGLVLRDQDKWDFGSHGPMPAISVTTAKGNAVAQPGGATANLDNVLFVNMESVHEALGRPEPRKFANALNKVRCRSSRQSVRP